MCDDAVAEFACADRHAARGEDRERLKEIKRCLASQNSASGACCPLTAEAGLMIGKTMTLVRTVLSAEDKPRQRHHKFKDYKCLKLLKYSSINYFPTF